MENHWGMLLWSRQNGRKKLGGKTSRALLSSDWVARVTRRRNLDRFGRMRGGIRQFTDVRRNWFRGDRNYFFRKSRHSFLLSLSRSHTLELFSFLCSPVRLASGTPRTRSALTAAARRISFGRDGNCGLCDSRTRPLQFLSILRARDTILLYILLRIIVG